MSTPNNCRFIYFDHSHECREGEDCNDVNIDAPTTVTIGRRLVKKVGVRKNLPTMQETIIFKRLLKISPGILFLPMRQSLCYF